VWVYDPKDGTATLVHQLNGNIEAIEMIPGINDKLLLKNNPRSLTVLKDILTPSSTTHYTSPVTVGEFKDIEAIGTCGDYISKKFCILNDTGWIYTKDSFDDSSSPVAVGNTEFEIYGMATRVDKDTVTVAINSRLPVGGMSYHGTQITWGDIVFDFFDPNNPEESKIKYGVHFDAASNSGVEDGVGLYKVTGLKSVAKANRGHANFTTYKNYISRKGGHPSLGDLPIVDNGYFGNTDAMPTSIKTGIKVANDEFVMLNKSQLAGMGLDFATGLSMDPEGLEPGDNPLPIYPYGDDSPDGVPYPDNEGPYYGDDFGLKPPNELGRYTFGFSFKRQEADMKGEFLIHLFVECGNDGIVLKGILPDC
jgi:hypothetical protein